jgi:hypothetical protein
MQKFLYIIGVKRNWCTFETVTDSDMEQHGNYTETHKIYPEMLDTHSANVNAIFKLFLCTP